MTRRSRNAEFIDLVAAELPVDDEYTMPEQSSVEPPKIEDWFPPLGPKGMEVFLSDKKNLLLHGERFSGKTFAGLHRVMRGLHDNDGASACLATLTRSQAILGGLWTKFQLVLQAWAEGIELNGKFYPGLGVRGEGKNGEFVFKTDDARNRYVWIQNAHGGWSMAFLRTMLHGDQIGGRVKSMEFTTFLYDELTDTDDESYFTKPIQQLYRIPGVSPQQFIGCCNPSDEGEDHWVFKRFFTGFDDPKAKIVKLRAEYGVFHIPITDNTFVPEEQKRQYLGNVMEEARTDPTAYDRLILGKWVKRPTGKGLFARYWRREIHTRGDLAKKQIIIPSGSVIDVSYDIGTANTSITFEERLLTKKGEVTTWFDEIVLVDEYVPIPQLAPILLAQMNYWCGRTQRELFFNHIADSASFDQMRPDGSYDARKLEQEVARELRENHERVQKGGNDLYPYLKHVIYLPPQLNEFGMPHDEFGRPLAQVLNPKPVELIPCEKPDGSVASRTKMLISRLQSECLIVSARCVKHIEMFENIPEDPDKPLQPPKGSRFKHAYDSGSYAMYHYEMGGHGNVVRTGGHTRLTELHA